MAGDLEWGRFGFRDGWVWVGWMVGRGRLVAWRFVFVFGWVLGMVDAGGGGDVITANDEWESAELEVGSAIGSNGTNKGS